MQIYEVIPVSKHHAMEV